MVVEVYQRKNILTLLLRIPEYSLDVNVELCHDTKIEHVYLLYQMIRCILQEKIIGYH